MPKRSRSYRAAQLERLKDPNYAAEYINAAMEAGDDAALLLALRNVVEARTVNSVASEAGLSRESIYRMLSETGNPCYSSLLGILGALGLQFKIQPTLQESSLVWEVHDRPGPYYSQRLEEFTRALRQFGNAASKDESSTMEREVMEMAA